ncbi:MAG: hypothetical protein QNJ97_06850 [Myxococcota bacterium]|nr:hypothetical protein [Myxococcota bacterium]
MTSQDKPIRLSGTETAWLLLEVIDEQGSLRLNDLLKMAQALAVCVRASHLIAFDRLCEVQGAFPASIESLLDAPDPEIDADQAGVDLNDYLGMIDIVDLLSDAQLPCVAPRLHRGWQDKTQSCREARAIAQRALEMTIVRDFRGSLMGALAIFNRTSLVPGPVAIDPHGIRAAVDAVLQLVQGLSRPRAGSNAQRILDNLRDQLGTAS